jgi:peptidoglycan/xylan/chitin deacetylase (PgdA/CDA1 family)
MNIQNTHKKKKKFPNDLNFAFIIAASTLCPTHLTWAVTRIAITVDDLPAHANTLPSESRLTLAKRFIRVLKKNQIHEAYGFINAKNVVDTPENKHVLQEWVGAGHPIANHTYSHFNLHDVSVGKFIEDVKNNEPLLKELQQQGSIYWFRYPYLREGNTPEKRTQVRSELGKMGYKIAQVTIDFEDWAWNNAYVRCAKKRDKTSIGWLKQTYLHHANLQLDQAIAASQKLFGREIPHILLLHIGIFDSLMLDTLLETYRKRGVEFVKLAEAAADPVYSINPDITMTRGETFLSQIALARGTSLPPTNPLPLKELENICKNEINAPTR